MYDVKLSCPYCGHRIIQWNLCESQYGSPIRTCKRCKKEYVDKRYREIAVEGIAKWSMSVKARIALIVIGSFVIYRGIYLLGGYKAYNLLSFYLLPVAFLIMGTALLIGGSIDLILILSGEKEKRLERLRQESIKRLQNYMYAHRLKDLGYSVPEEYL